MTDISVFGFLVFVISLFLIVYPGESISFRIAVLLLLITGWAFITTANEIGKLREKIEELSREIEQIKRRENS